ncbi:MAG: tetratricopeptide repeat protein [Sphingobacteriales bacterium]|nr:MAG: tetratricopeptide repeat protein [Sphingobacteriales bacterium]
MKKLTIAFLHCLLAVAAIAQTQTTAQLHETARSFIKQGDYANAILVLNRAKQQEPSNIPVTKDLAISYYYQNDNTKAMETINSIINNDAIDDQTYLIAGMIYKRSALVKDLEKIYRKALKKFPESGPLYNELGELLWDQKNFDAIKQWEKGIETDPSYSKNYFNAAKYYYLTPDKVWSLLYGEIFINMEPLSNKTPEMKQILLNGYKKLFADADIEKSITDKTPFVKAIAKEINNQSAIAATGISTETLTMIRTRFILGWFGNADQKFKYRLFSYQQQLLREGLFDAYNQWIFGSAQNLGSYQNWVNTNSKTYDEFLNFQKGRIFKVPAGEYYK